MGGVGLLCSYGLLVFCSYVFVNVVVLMILPTIVFWAVALVVDVNSTALLLRITVNDYSKYILLFVVRVVRRKFNWFRLGRIATKRIKMTVQCWVKVLYRQDRVKVAM